MSARFSGTPIATLAGVKHASAARSGGARLRPDASEHPRRASRKEPVSWVVIARVICCCPQAS